MQVKLNAVTQALDFAVRRDLTVTDSRTQVTREIQHYHFTGWQDWQLPEGPSRQSLSTLVEQAAAFVTANNAKVGDERQRLLVHCRAGIGRTGTTISLIHSIIGIKEQLALGVAEPSLSIFSIVRRLRE
mmetsp:Transcript_27206/g.36348  ORF Transcript_27206/g.36348 Transcript_27206/m.36348 type:complete len:129 (+) Transcript_27206:546-932(+)